MNPQHVFPRPKLEPLLPLLQLQKKPLEKLQEKPLEKLQEKSLEQLQEKPSQQLQTKPLTTAGQDEATVVAAPTPV